MLGRQRIVCLSLVKFSSFPLKHYDLDDSVALGDHICGQDNVHTDFVCSSISGGNRNQAE